MSWIFSVISEKPFMEWEIEKFVQTHNTPLFTIIKPSFYLAVGGLTENVIVHYETPDQTSGWLVIGKSYLVKDTGYGFADKNDWQKFINGELNLDDLDGNYLIYRWENQYIEVWNDALGLQDCFFTKSQGYVLLSSRIDWISQFIEKKNWNYSAFASMLLLNNPLHQDSLLKNVGRLGQSGYVRATIHKFLLKNLNFNLMSENPTDKNRFAFYLNKALLLPNEQVLNTNIAFDHDFASKYLLSFMMNKPKKYWNLISWDSPDLSKKQLFDKMEKSLYIPVYENARISSGDHIEKEWKEFIFSTHISNLETEFFKTSFFDDIYSKKFLFYQLQFNDFIYRNSEYDYSFSFKRGVEKADLNLLQKYFSIDIQWMRKEFLSFLIKGLQIHLKEYFTRLNLSSEMNFQFFADQTALLGRGIHLHGKKSVWLDNHVINYNPMLLASLIRMKYNLPENSVVLRRNFAQLIESNYPEITFYLKQKEQKISVNEKSQQNLFLYPLVINLIEERINRKDTENSPYYDIKKIQKLFEKSKNGNKSCQQQMIKWMSFEFWREKTE